VTQPAINKITKAGNQNKKALPWKRNGL